MKINTIGLAVLLAAFSSCRSKSVTVAPTPPATPTITTPMAPDTEVAAGKVAYENNCAKCHRLFEAKEFSKNDWAPILVRMQKKSHLENAEIAQISNYIYSQL